MSASNRGPLTDAERGEIEQRIQYRFRDTRVLDQALTHASFSHEATLDATSHYDRLEFLGDAVIGLLLATHAFQASAEASSGELSLQRSRLARRASLAAAAERLELGLHARLSAGERHHGGPFRRRLLADLYEALVGAIFLDGGLESARAFVLESLISKIGTSSPLAVDFKSALQELVQAQGKPGPSYKVVETGGPPHAPTFLVQVEIEGHTLGEGIGGSKREAEQAAARVAMRALKRDEATER